LDAWKNWSLGGEIGDAINRCFKFDTIEEIAEALKKEVGITLTCMTLLVYFLLKNTLALMLL
jgi:hypothetical protein